MLEREENPQFWRYIVDEVNNRKIKLTNDQIKLLKKIKDRRFISEKVKNTNYFYEIEHCPLQSNTTNIKKANFVPSKHE